MTIPVPSDATLRHVVERVRADDTAWLRDRHASGDLAWLRELLPADGYAEFESRLAAGDLDWVRLRVLTLPVFRAAGGAPLGELPLRHAATATSTSVAAPATARTRQPRPERRRLWWALAVIAVVGASAVALTQLRSDDTSAIDTAADLTVATAPATAADGTAGATNATDVSDTADTADTADTSASTTKKPLATGDTIAVGAAARDGDLLATANAAGSFTTLTRALGVADLTATLQGTGPFTLFAPTDEAFTKLPPGVLDVLLRPENKAVLQSVLKYHVVVARVEAGKVGDGAIQSAEGSPIEAATVDGRLIVNGANVTTADVETSNGLLQVIDAVLIPPTVDLPPLLEAAGIAPASTSGASTASTEPAAATTTPTNAAGDAVPEALTVYFANGSAVLDAAANEKITSAVDVLSKLAPGTTVNVVGHASATGDAKANQTLSERRAKAVVGALTAKLGTLASRLNFTTSARGDSEPVADVASSRRVTIEVAG